MMSDQIAPAVPDAATDATRRLIIGLDVGSTTVKAVVADAADGALLWKAYERHATRQAEKCLEMLEGIEAAFPHMRPEDARIFTTGSGAGAVGDALGACFVQEVNAVCLAAEKYFPDVGSLIELGGQDAKIVVFQERGADSRKKKIPSMNDKCAGGTGAVIDKISAKLGMTPDALRALGYDGIRLHSVAGKCGVFAETDINGLQKQGVAAEELMASLFEAVVQQNLSVLTRGHTLRPTVLLLGGPNYFLPGLQACWRANLAQLWRERGVAIPDRPLEDLICVPENAQYFGAIGAAAYGIETLADGPDQGRYRGAAALRRELASRNGKRARGVPGLGHEREQLRRFMEAYAPRVWQPPTLVRSAAVDVFLGVDAGSTSTKAVLVDAGQRILAKAYQLSRGNPIEDCKEVLAALEAQMKAQDCVARILGAATTGYAKDMLAEVMGADVALVETVAHAQSGLHFYPDADVICDVGGQDIKVIILKNGAVKDFRLNTQCSAGNGYFLQATAADFGYSVDEYAEAALSAEAMPAFGYGCAVFMQSDIVDFQRQGWQRHEIMAGLAAVLPKNIWLYVCRMPNLSALGRTFVLQGGTQRNLAAVKAQVDFIQERFAGTGVAPRVVVHTHASEAGAIGCAFEAHRRHQEEGLRTRFIGFDAMRKVTYRSTRSEETRCSFCKNKCLRTFIDVHSGRSDAEAPAAASGVPLAPDARRIIIASCEKGAAEDVAAVRGIKAEQEALRARYPNLAAVAAKQAFLPVNTPLVADAPPAPRWYLRGQRRIAARARREAIARRPGFRIGMPRVLNMYALAPFFMGFFQSLGLNPRNLVWSDHTSEALFRAGAKRGSIDPCYPSKAALAHVHHLLHRKGPPLDAIFFPMVDGLPTWLDGVVDSRTCPAATATPESVHAAFIKEGDLFGQMGVAYKKTFLDLREPLLCARMLAREWAEPLGVTEEESRRAVAAGFNALAACQAARRAEGRAVLETLEREQRLGIVLLARPYHSDPGVSHGICETFQQLGYPVLTLESLPLDEALMSRLFGEELRKGELDSPFDIGDVWKNSYSEHTSRKLWAAKVAARHPNLVALELSSFKCGHDAPAYMAVEEIIERSGTPFFSFRDLDENKPAAALRIRIETIGYFLDRYRAMRLAEWEKRARIAARLDGYEAALRDAGAAAASASVA